MVKDAASAILSQFPETDYAFAYGSSVVSQSKKKVDPLESFMPRTMPATSPEQMMDFIFAVDDPVSWHRKNIRKHADHYSFLSMFGAERVAAIQDIGPGVYYNPYAKVMLADGTVAHIKYGVVETARLCRDLMSWDRCGVRDLLPIFRPSLNTFTHSLCASFLIAPPPPHTHTRSLYLAGRMHKPIVALRESERVRIAASYNTDAAVAFALLTLPQTFSELELYAAVAGISYLGDPRIAAGAEPADKARRRSSVALLLLRTEMSLTLLTLAPPPSSSLASLSRPTGRQTSPGCNSRVPLALLPRSRFRAPPGPKPSVHCRHRCQPLRHASRLRGPWIVPLPLPLLLVVVVVVLLPLSLLSDVTLLAHGRDAGSVDPSTRSRLSRSGTRPSQGHAGSGPLTSGAREAALLLAQRPPSRDVRPRPAGCAEATHAPRGG